MFGGDSAAGGGGREGRLGSAAAQHGAARRNRRDPAAAGAAGIVDHARQGESIGARDGQPGVLPGDRLRRGDPRRGRCRTARTERDDAGDRVERAARDARSSPRRCGCCRRGASRGSRQTRLDAASCSTGAPRSRPRSARTSATPQTADIAKTSVQTGRTIRELVRERGLLPEARLDAILSAEAMTSPGVPGQDQRCRTSRSAGAYSGSPGDRPGGRRRRCRRRSTRGCSGRRISANWRARIATQWQRSGQDHGRAGGGRGSRRR